MIFESVSACFVRWTAGGDIRYFNRRHQDHVAILVAPACCHAVLLGVWLGLQWLGLNNVSGAPDVAAVAASVAGRHVSIVADVQPAVARLGSESFSVTVGDARLPAQAVPLLSDRSTVGIVLDASAANGPALRAGLVGAAKLLSQIPATAHTAVIADSEPPKVLAPARREASNALQALDHVQPAGERATPDAVTLALRELSATSGRPRVILLYTSGADAGGETADDLAARLTRAQTVLAVITAQMDTWYWSRVVAATGGVVVAARPSSAAAAFDDVVDTLRTRYMLTFPAPEGLTAWVSLHVRTADGTLTTETLVPGQDAIRDNIPSSGPQPNRGAERLSLVTLVAALIGAVTLILAWRFRSNDAGEPRVAPQTLAIVPPGPGRVSTSNESPTSTASKLSEFGAQSPQISGRDPPAEITSSDEEAINNSTGDLHAEAGPTAALYTDHTQVALPGLSDEGPPGRDATTVCDDRIDSYPKLEGDNGEEREQASTLTSPSHAVSVPRAVTTARQRVQALTAKARAAAKGAS